MTNRRHFLQIAGAVALASNVPALSAPPAVARRRIPGTDESLAVVGLGNSNAFRQRDFETSRALLKTYFDRGGRYVDCSGDGALLVASTARSLGHDSDLFLGAYFSGADTDASEAAAAQLRATAGKKALDLMHTYPEDGVPHWDCLLYTSDAADESSSV